MAKTALEQWDETAASNTDVGSINIDEGCNPSGMNNAMREHMSQTAKWLGDDTLTSAAPDLGTVPGRYISITGTTTITAFGTIKAGTIKYLKFADALTLTHNATSLILPGAANITTAAGDTAIVVSEGSGNWRCLAYQRAAHSPIVSGTFTPTLACGTSGTITLNAGSILGYVKNGPLVTVTGLLTVDSVSSPSGTVTMSTLPFTSANANRGYATAPLWVSGYVGTAGVVWQAFISSNSTSASLGFYSQASGATGTNPSALFQAGTVIVFSASYLTA